jgi:hypothetical protein
MRAARGMPKGEATGKRVTIGRASSIPPRRGIILLMITSL